MKTDSEPTTVVNSSPAEPSWSSLVERIRSGERSAMEDLYLLFSKGIRFYLCRQLGPQDLDDTVHDIFLIITQSIQRGELRDPERLMGYVRTIVRRQVAARIDGVVHARRSYADLDFGMTLSDQRPNPEHKVIDQQNSELARRVLNSLQKRDREVLARFYLQEQTPDRICADMNLTETQFRLIKSRAKARFAELGKRRMALRTGFQLRPRAINI